MALLCNIFNPSEFHLRCESLMALLCSRVRTELVGMYFQSIRISFTLWRFHGLALQPDPNWTHGDLFSIHQNFMFAVKVSLPCSAASSKVNSWGCVFNRLEFHLRCEGFMALLCSRVRTELARMYFQSIRISFTLWRSHGAALQPGPSWTHGMYFQSLRISFTLWRFHGLALHPGPSWIRGDVFSIP